jgi:DivIVA domain-containing protein
MQLHDRRLTGRDVLAKTFQAKTKRGYDPIEVDSYLELVASQIDVLHGDMGRNVEAAPTEITSLENPSTAEERTRLAAGLQELGAERDALAAAVGELNDVNESLRAENGQLRSQLTSVAPPPPIAPNSTPEVAPIQPEAVAKTEADDRANEESYLLVLRMAHRSAEEAIAEAHSRADEIVAEANLTSSQIARESDRKAYEAANKVQAELASLSTEVETQQGELAHLRSRVATERDDLREMAQKILQLADDERRPLEGVEVVDLRTAPSDTPA